METNEKDTSASPPGKDDWIRFGALEARAKSKKIWQVVALIAITGIIALTITDGWLFLERQLRFERLTDRCQALISKNQTLRNQVSSVNEAIKKYGRVINSERSEKNLITVERGILQAQVELLMAEVESLEAEIVEQDSQTESATEPTGQLEQPKKIVLATETPTQ